MLIWAIALKVRGIISTVNIVSGLRAGYQRVIQVDSSSALLTRPQACGRWFMVSVLLCIVVYCVARSSWSREAVDDFADVVRSSSSQVPA